MNAITLLRADHRAILRLIDRIRDATDPIEARKLCDELCDAAELHTALETEVWWPRLRSWLRGRARELLDRDGELHWRALVELEALREDGLDVRTSERAREAFHFFEKHFMDEEQELFPAVERKLPVDELERLGRDLEVRRHELGGEGLHLPAVA